MQANRYVLSHTDHCLNDLIVESAVGLRPLGNSGTMRAADYTGLWLSVLRHGCCGARTEVP